jgi:threonyl-tRNA synthetase
MAVRYDSIGYEFPERFDLTYIAPDGSKKRPIMLHRVIYGSVERFIGILIEHYGGAFPMWLAPVQAVIVPVNPDLHSKASYELAKRLEDLDIRVKVDDRNEKLGYRIREAQITKIPVQLVLGDGEMANNSINIRRYGQASSETLPVDEFIAKLLLEISEKR